MKEKVECRQYWPIRSNFAMIDTITMKGKRIIIPFLLYMQKIQQLHSSHIGIEKRSLLMH